MKNSHLSTNTEYMFTETVIKFSKNTSVVLNCVIT